MTKRLWHKNKQQNKIKWHNNKHQENPLIFHVLPIFPYSWMKDKDNKQFGSCVFGNSSHLTFFSNSISSAFVNSIFASHVDSKSKSLMHLIHKLEG
jgi:hypothetical protein